MSASFFALFTQGQQQLQFILTQERVVITGDTAWISLDENLLGDHAGSTVAALNVFARSPDTSEWRMVVHHGSVVVTGPSIDGE